MDAVKEMKAVTYLFLLSFFLYLALKNEWQKTPFNYVVMVMPETEGPFEIARTLLSVTERSYWDRDFETFASCFGMPHVIGSLEGDTTVETRAELRAIFDTMGAHYNALGALAMRREANEAVLVDENNLRVMFVSQQVLPGQVLTNKIYFYSEVERVDGDWKITLTRAVTSDETLGPSFKPDR